MAVSILYDLFEYRETSPSGLIWKVDRGYQARKGTSAGWLDTSTGYYRVGAARRQYWAHRVVWMLHNGEIPARLQIDHVNGVRHDNRISNLRIADASENKCNVALRSDNAVGVKGLYWSKSLNLWVGEIMLYGKRMCKTSRDRDVVEGWLVETRANMHGEYARHG